MFFTVIAFKYALLVGQWSYGHFLKPIRFYLNNAIDLRIISCYTHKMASGSWPWTLWRHCHFRSLLATVRTDCRHTVRLSSCSTDEGGAGCLVIRCLIHRVKWRYGAIVPESTRSGIKPARPSPVTVVIHTTAARPAVPSVNSWPSLVFCCSLHLLEHSAQRHSMCTISFFLSPAAKDIPVSSILRWHYPRAYSKEFFGVHNFKSSCMM